MSTNTLKTASVLAFERKIDPSDAWMCAGVWEQREQHADWPSIAIREKTVRGTISNRQKTGAQDSNAAKIDAEVQKPNLQRIETATLPSDCDTLKVQFTIRVLGGVGVPSACNNADYRKRLDEVVSGYRDASQFAELAKRYAQNIANGRFLWRNRLVAEQIEVRVRQQVNGQSSKEWVFDAMSVSTTSFSPTADSGTAARIAELADGIQQGLLGKSYTLFEVTALVRMGRGQEVYPSQELVMDKADNEASRILYAVRGEDAGMHSQKIGNAIRTIDDWYSEADTYGPIAVEPFGAVTTLGKAMRPPKKGDFYTLLDQWVLKGKEPDPSHQHYVIANLIRGGVFGDSEKSSA